MIEKHWSASVLFRAALCAGVLAIGTAGPALAVTITPDYTSLGTVYQDAGGQLYTAAGAGRSDVTTAFKADVTQAFTYLQNAITVPWNETIAFTLSDIGAGAVADSGIDSYDGDGSNNLINRPATSTIRMNTHTGIVSYIDATPANNSEFSMASGTAALGGGTLNNKHFGDATAAAAQGKYDMLTLILHEAEHSLGISSGSARFLAVAGPSANANRTLTIPNTLSGLPNNFDIPITTGSAHIVGDPSNNDTFGYTVVADPGWGSGQRALLTSPDILAVGQVEGATANQLVLIPVPEPTALTLLGLGCIGLLGRFRRRRIA